MHIALFVQFWKEVVEDTEVRELIWDKSNAAQGKRIHLKLHSKQPLWNFTRNL